MNIQGVVYWCICVFMYLSLCASVYSCNCVFALHIYVLPLAIVARALKQAYAPNRAMASEPARPEERARRAAFKIALDHCKEVQRLLLEDLRACDDEVEFERIDRKVLNQFDYTDQFRRLVRIEGGAERFRTYMRNRI